MKTTHTLYTARLNNNCPTCFATDGLELTFSQDKTENKFYEKAEKEINSKMYCHTCKHAIFPVNWTDDIERVYAYNRKLAKPTSPEIKLKPLLYAILVISTLLLGILLSYFI
jgi:hypothetical protein